MADTYPLMLFKMHEGQLRTREVLTPTERWQATVEGWVDSPPYETMPTRAHPLDILEEYVKNVSKDPRLPVVMAPRVEQAWREAKLLRNTRDSLTRKRVANLLEGIESIKCQASKTAYARHKSRPHSPLDEVFIMISTLRNVELDGLSLEDLLFVEQALILAAQGYAAHQLDVPQAIAKRQKEVARKITARIEEEIEALEQEARDLEDKAKKREEAAAKAAKLRATLEKS